MKTAPAISATTAAFALFALGACSPGKTEAEAGASADAGSMSNPVAGASAGVTEVVTMTAQQFADAIAASDAFEVESSRIAVQSATSAAVKDFAGKMIAAHTASSAELISVLGKTEPAVKPHPVLTEIQKGRIEALRTSGEGFDNYYVDRQIEAHEQALAMLRAYAGTAAPGPLRDFAARLAPKVADHLAMARKLLR